MATKTTAADWHLALTFHIVKWFEISFMLKVLIGGKHYNLDTGKQ